MTAQLPFAGFSPPSRSAALPAEDQPAARLRHLGAGSLSSAELLALQISSPDPLRVACRLLAEYGNIYEVTRAPVGGLAQFPGLGPASAVRISAAVEIGNRARALPDPRPRVTSPTDAANLVMAEMQVLEQEEMHVLLLDTRSRVIAIHKVYKGSTDTILIRVGELFRAAIRHNAKSIIVAHNHPSGDPAPSPEDVAITKSIVEAGKLLDIAVFDHIIIGLARFISLKEQGLGF